MRFEKDLRAVLAHLVAGIPTKQPIRERFLRLFHMSEILRCEEVESGSLTDWVARHIMACPKVSDLTEELRRNAAQQSWLLTTKEVFRLALNRCVAGWLAHCSPDCAV